MPDYKVAGAQLWKLMHSSCYDDRTDLHYVAERRNMEASEGLLQASGFKESPSKWDLLTLPDLGKGILDIMRLLQVTERSDRGRQSLRATTTLGIEQLATFEAHGQCISFSSVRGKNRNTCGYQYDFDDRIMQLVSKSKETEPADEHKELTRSVCAVAYEMGHRLQSPVYRRHKDLVPEFLKGELL